MPKQDVTVDPMCMLCVWYRMNDSEDPQSCVVFDKIPDEIWTGQTNHDKPFKGDHGVVFILDTGFDAMEKALKMVEGVK